MNTHFINALSRTILAASSLEEVHWLAKSLTHRKIESKQWLSNEVLNIIQPQSVLIVGSWYPTILPILLGGPNVRFDCVDINPNVKQLSDIFNDFYYKDNPVKTITMDAELYLSAADHRRYDLIVNTSCEHMSFDMKDIVRKGNTIYAFQSNNYKQVSEHINCKDTLEQFVESTGLTKILYSGILALEKYERYMVIGQVE